MHTQENAGMSKVSSGTSVLTYTVDSFLNGIAFGQHKLEADQDPRDYYSLRIRDDSELVRLRSRYVLHKDNPLAELERQLMRLSTQGVLRSAVIYLGTTTDPFHPFAGKFDASMKFLELFMRYTPGKLIVQTRSPLVVIAMPVFRKLGQRAAVTIGVETPNEDAVARYTPGLPRFEERLKAATALRRFGIPVTLQVSPVLPYGDWRGDASKFAEILVASSDYVYVRSITDGTDRVERQIRATTLAKRLAEDRKFHWLRPDTAVPLLNAVEDLAPEKLKAPNFTKLGNRQLDMFAA
jgi:DNA repair photolyase